MLQCLDFLIIARTSPSAVSPHHLHSYFCCLWPVRLLPTYHGFSLLQAAASAAAGPEQAVHWLAEHEHDFDGGSAASPQQAAGTSPVPSVRLQGAGVAGILRREAQLAARNDE